MFTGNTIAGYEFAFLPGSLIPRLPIGEKNYPDSCAFFRFGFNLYPPLMLLANIGPIIKICSSFEMAEWLKVVG